MSAPTDPSCSVEHRAPPTGASCCLSFVDDRGSVVEEALRCRAPLRLRPCPLLWLVDEFLPAKEALRRPFRFRKSANSSFALAPIRGPLPRQPRRGDGMPLQALATTASNQCCRTRLPNTKKKKRTFERRLFSFFSLLERARIGTETCLSHRGEAGKGRKNEVPQPAPA